MRNQSFALTTRQYVDGTKNVTRRLGWAFAKVGHIYCGVEKCQGLKKDEKIVRLGTHEIVSLRWERLDLMLTDELYGKAEVIKEGFAWLTPLEFVKMFVAHNRCLYETLVHRMEFVKLPWPQMESQYRLF